MDMEVEDVLFDALDIQKRIDEMADQITEDFGPDQQLLVMPILTGAFIFAADLVRRLPNPIHIEWLRVSSYIGKATQSHEANIISTLPDNLSGKKLLIIDDILDSGKTLQRVTHELNLLNPALIKTCVLLHKKHTNMQPIMADYVGFTVPDRFVVGYGLDYAGYYRNIDQIITLKSI